MSVLLARLDLSLRLFSAVQETIWLIAYFDNVTVVGQPGEQRLRHLCIPKHSRPLHKGQVRCNQYAGVLI